MAKFHWHGACCSARKSCTHGHGSCKTNYLNAGQTFCRMLQGEHSLIHSTLTKLPFVIKIFVLSIFEWPFHTGFNVVLNAHKVLSVLLGACAFRSYNYGYLFKTATCRALTRILKTGVQDSHLAKSRSPTGKSGSPTQKKLESHQFVRTVYLFYFSRK